MECPACNGAGCEECNAGRIEIRQCPLELITPDVWDTLHYAALYEKGLPPLAGGSLDQAYNFTQSARIIWADQGRYKQELGIFE